MANTTERRYFVNNAPQTTLTSGISNTDTSVVVSSLTGWPASTPFLAILEANSANQEIVEVQSVVGTTLTITRGQDGSAAVSHLSGATIDHGVVRRDVDEANAHSSATSAVHGVAGAVVGTTDTQTLTNKAIQGGSITEVTEVATTGTVTAGGNVTASGTVSGAQVNSSGDVSAAGAVLSAGLTCQIRFPSFSSPDGTTQAFTGGVADVNTLGVTADGASGTFNSITIPTGQGGRYKISGQAAVTDVTHRLESYLAKNGVGAAAAIMHMLVGPSGGGSVGNSLGFPEREFTFADGDKIYIVGAVPGAASWTSTSSNGFETWLRVERVG